MQEKENFEENVQQKSEDILETVLPGNGEPGKIIQGNEHDFRKMIDALPAAIYTTDAEGRLTHFNPAAVEFSGRTPELGTDRWCVTWKLFYPDGTHMPHNECPMAEALKEGKSIKGAEAIAELPDGERKWFEAYPSSLRDNEGNIIGGINMLIDITEQKEAEKQINRSEQEFTDLFNNATVGLHFVGPDGIILRANQAELDLLGYSREEYVGRHIADFHADQEVIDDILEKLTGAKELDNYEARLRCKDGSIKHVIINSNVLWEDGEFIHTRCFTRDITHRKRTELLQEEQNNLSELIASGAPLDECLTTLCNAIPKFSSGIRVAVLSVDEQQKTFKRPVAPDLDTSFIDGLEGARINDPNLGTCGIAVRNGIAAQSIDITKEEAWSKEVRDICIANDIMAIHSTPVFGKDGNVIASFSLLLEEPRKPCKWEYQLAEIGAHIASIALERERSRKALQKSERWFRQMLEKLPAAAYTCDPEGQITFFNEQAAEVWGREPELNSSLDRFCGSVQLYLSDGSPVSHNDCWMALALKNEKEYNGKEIIIEGPDGQRVTGLAYISPIHDESGELIGAVNIVVDISKRKQMEEALRESEEKYQTLFDSMPVAGFVCDTSGVLQYYNDRAAELWGRKPKCGDPKEKYCGSFKLYLPDGTHLPHSQSPLVEVLRDGEPIHNVEVYIEQPEGSRIPVMVNFSPLKNMNGEVEGVITSFEDISELKSTQKELHEINETLEKRVENRTKSLLSYQRQLRSLASKLSKAEELERRRLAAELHDNLGQMLAIGKMKIDLMQGDQLSEPIASDISELKELMENSLTYTRDLMSDLKPPPSLDKEDVRVTIRWLAEKMQKHDLKVIVEDDGQPKRTSEEIRTTLLQCVRELLFNVIKHTEVSEARVSMTRLDNQVQIIVEDEGQGFDPETKTSASTEEGGFGLFNIRERMDLLGCSIDIDSKSGKGTKIKLTASLEEEVEKQVTTNQSTHQPTNSTNSPKVSVLLVDDHQMMRKGLKKIVDAEDDMMVIAEASDGEEAVKCARENSPDVILMDINMPGMDGIQATQKIKSAMPNAYIIGLSVHNHDDVAQDMKSAGASAYLTKDEAFETLCATIRSEAANRKE